MTALFLWRRSAHLAPLSAAIALAALATSAVAQPAAVVPAPQGGQPGGQQGNVGFGFGPGAGAGPPLNLFGGAEGGAANADFESLIELITSTVEVDSWMENGTGQGEIQPFPTGVYVDAAGALRIDRGGRRATELARLAARGVAGSSKLTDDDRREPPAAAGSEVAPRGASLRSVPRRPSESKPVETVDARVASDLRFVSLPRLERAIAMRQLAREPLDPAMLSLAGLQRIEFVVVYPETGDLVLAGSAGDWRTERGALVSTDTGQPVVRLDDLLTLLRRRAAEGTAAFGCKIVPRQEGLARVQDYLARTSGQPLPAGGRGKWLADLRDALGEQDVEFMHIDADTRVARLILAADFHMKLIGMGLAKGVAGVPSYLDTVRLGPDGQPPAMTVIRWWFSMPASRVESSDDRRAFALPESCVEVLSENELLAARGERIHTGQSDELTAGFARSFTEHFPDLSAKFQVYGELQRIFEMALALALIERESLFAQAGWQPTHLLSAENLRLPRVTTPRTVETVVNHRTIARRHIIAGVSGGVWIDPVKQIALAAGDSTNARLADAAAEQPAPADEADVEPIWWWD